MSDAPKVPIQGPGSRVSPVAVVPWRLSGKRIRRRLRDTVTSRTTAVAGMIPSNPGRAED